MAMPRSSSRLTALKRLTAADVMSPHPISIPRTKSVRKAAEILSVAGIETAPVTDKTGRLVGVLSIPDVRIDGTQDRGAGNENYARHAVNAGIYPQSQQNPRLTVQQIMNPDVTSVERDAPIAQVVEQFVDRKIRHLFVTDHDGALVGGINVFDVLKILGELLDPKSSTWQAGRD